METGIGPPFVVIVIDHSPCWLLPVDCNTTSRMTRKVIITCPVVGRDRTLTSELMNQVPGKYCFRRDSQLWRLVRCVHMQLFCSTTDAASYDLKWYASQYDAGDEQRNWSLRFVASRGEGAHVLHICWMDIVKCHDHNTLLLWWVCFISWTE